MNQIIIEESTNCNTQASFELDKKNFNKNKQILIEN
jgi:hypothetical protein